MRYKRNSSCALCLCQHFVSFNTLLSKLFKNVVEKSQILFEGFLFDSHFVVKRFGIEMFQNNCENFPKRNYSFKNKT